MFSWLPNEEYEVWGNPLNLIGQVLMEERITWRNSWSGYEMCRARDVSSDPVVDAKRVDVTWLGPICHNVLTHSVTNGIEVLPLFYFVFSLFF